MSQGRETFSLCCESPPLETLGGWESFPPLAHRACPWVRGMVSSSRWLLLHLCWGCRTDTTQTLQGWVSEGGTQGLGGRASRNKKVQKEDKKLPPDGSPVEAPSWRNMASVWKFPIFSPLPLPLSLSWDFSLTKKNLLLQQGFPQPAGGSSLDPGWGERLEWIKEMYLKGAGVGCTGQGWNCRVKNPWLRSGRLLGGSGSLTIRWSLSGGSQTVHSFLSPPLPLVPLRTAWALNQPLTLWSRLFDLWNYCPGFRSLGLRIPTLPVVFFVELGQFI